jgi:hypothetical protein
MKFFLILSILLISNNLLAKDLTGKFITLQLKYNQEQKYYETSFSQKAGVYKADDKFFKCLQNSLESKKIVNVTYQAMGLKIIGCDN